MPRPKSPCGTYPAYQRHLKEKTTVDAACRSAQQERDAGRGRRRRGFEPPQAVPVPVVDRLYAGLDATRVMFGKCVTDLAEFVAEDYLYGVADLMGEMNDLLDEWCALQAQLGD